MKAPEILYVDTHQDLSDSFLYAFAKKDNDNDIEYVHKDAFIENACMNLKKLMYDNLMFQERLHREEIIDNFIKDFKNYMNYMKGE